MPYVRYEQLTDVKPLLSSERTLHKGCDRKGSVEKKKFLVIGLKGVEAKRS
jgi:hypothetical protein